MEKELECKLLLDDVEILRQQLAEKGAQLFAEEKQINRTYDSKDCPIEGESYLRIRTVSDVLNSREYSEMTFKKKIENQMIREFHEFTSSIGSPDNMAEILKEMGYHIIHCGEKRRISYRYKNARFDFDYWDKNTYPYPYVEIEVQQEQQLKELLQEFHIPDDKVSFLSITQLRKNLMSEGQTGYTE